jgi:hypothetical protein
MINSSVQAAGYDIGKWVAAADHAHVKGCPADEQWGCQEAHQPAVFTTRCEKAGYVAALLEDPTRF